MDSLWVWVYNECTGRCEWRGYVLLDYALYCTVHTVRTSICTSVGVDGDWRRKGWEKNSSKNWLVICDFIRKPCTVKCNKIYLFIFVIQLNRSQLVKEHIHWMVNWTNPFPMNHVKLSAVNSYESWRLMHWWSAVLSAWLVCFLGCHFHTWFKHSSSCAVCFC